MTLHFPTASFLAVDLQCGFSELCPAELPVPGALAIIPNINRLLALPWARIDASQDWHPPDHCSFFGQRDNLYPPHCIAGSPGAEFLPGVDTTRFQTIWRKGFERDRDAYAVTAQHPALVHFLKESGIRTVVVAGLALNICCYFSALDLRRAGFEVAIVEDASAGIEVPAAGLFQAKAREHAEKLGVRYWRTAEIVGG